MDSLVSWQSTQTFWLPYRSLQGIPDSPVWNKKGEEILFKATYWSNPWANYQGWYCKPDNWDFIDN